MDEMSHEIERQTYDIGEAARLLGISSMSVYLAVRRGELPTIKIGKRLLVPKAALNRLLAGAEAT
jgi:excisionase family DNA binding protein